MFAPRPSLDAPLLRIQLLLRLIRTPGGQEILEQWKSRFLRSRSEQGGANFCADLIFGVRFLDLKQPLSQFDDRQIWHLPAKGNTASNQAPGLPRSDRVLKFEQQPGLAQASLSRDKNDLPSPRPSLLETFLQNG